MHLRKKRISVICMVVCMAVAAVLWSYPGVLAAGRVDMTQKGSLTLALATEDSDQMGQDMVRIEEPIQVYAWKLADMTEGGRYEFQGVFQALSIEDDSSQDGWKNLTQAAMELLFEMDEKGQPTGKPLTEPDYNGTVKVTEEGKQTETEGFENMELGLYFVLADNGKSPKYEYSFNPMIISLPWSEYQYAGGNASDTWQYAREATLKPARALRYGDIRIVKTLTSHNMAQGDVTFVFDVTAREGEEIVYSNVVSATFSAAGTQEILVSHIPAEVLVTVTEVYSGANCIVTVIDGESKAVLAAEEDGSTEPVSFRFENEYDEQANRGYGVENQFRYRVDQETGRSGYEWSTNRLDIGAGAEAGGGAGAETEADGNEDAGTETDRNGNVQ